MIEGEKLVNVCGIIKFQILHSIELVTEREMRKQRVFFLTFFFHLLEKSTGANSAAREINRLFNRLQDDFYVFNLNKIILTYTLFCSLAK